MLEWELSIGFEFKSNVLCKDIHTDVVVQMINIFLYKNLQFIQFF